MSDMGLIPLFLKRHDVLHSFYLDGFLQQVPPDLMRMRPHPRVNSIAWNIWHLARVEDVGLNRFVTDGTQVFADGDWAPRMNIDLHHLGGAMTFDEVDALSQHIDLTGLGDYVRAIAARTCEVVQSMRLDDLDMPIDAERLRKIVYDEGVARPGAAEGFFQNYLGRTKGNILMSLGLTHSFEHIGEMGVIAGLLGVELE